MSIRELIVRAAAWVAGGLPWARISRALKPPARVRLWRGMALAVARGCGMRRALVRSGGAAASGSRCDILLVSDALYPERGGGTRSLMQLARRLAGAGCRVAGVCEGPETRRFRVDGIDMHWVSSTSALPEVISSVGPRRLFVQQSWAPAGGAAGRAAGVPYWYFVRSTEELIGDSGEAFDADALGSAIRAALPSDPCAQHAAAVVGGAERVVANSAFMAGVIRAGFGREADVLYPEVDEPMPWEKRRGALSRCIVAVATTNKKGVGIVLELAKAFPEEVFLVCGFKELTPYLQSRIDKKVVRNLVPLGQIPTPATYALAKLVLMPSQWPEPFGRVNAEGLMRGIPVIASCVGGIPEIVTSERFLVREFRSPAAWAAQLRGFLEPGGAAAARAEALALGSAYSRAPKVPAGWIETLLGGRS